MVCDLQLQHSYFRAPEQQQQQQQLVPGAGEQGQAVRAGAAGGPSGGEVWRSSATACTSWMGGPEGRSAAASSTVGRT